MSRSRQDVTDAELSVLLALWDMDTASVRELAIRVYSSSAISIIATVQNLLKRLVAKKYVKCDRNLWPHRFCALVSRDTLIAQRLQTTADKLCGGQLQLLISSLLSTGTVSSELTD